MAWVSNETKMDTGQLYVSSDNGETYKVGTVDFRKLYHEPWVLNNGVGGFCYAEPPYKVAKLIKEEKETKTMEARKCERCGKLYEISSYASQWKKDGYLEVVFEHLEIHPDLEKNHSDSYIRDLKTGKLGFNHSSGKGICLCPECCVSLKRWWEHPESDDILEANNG